MSETMNLHQMPEAMTFHRALWAGRIMSAVVVIALVADGTIQLFAPAQIASMLQETGFAMDLTRVVGPIVLRKWEAADWYYKVWQSFAVLLPVQSVGVMGDQRTYKTRSVLRIVESQDGMIVIGLSF